MLPRIPGRVFRLFQSMSVWMVESMALTGDSRVEASKSARRIFKSGVEESQSAATSPR
jgi:hypothetical protein